MSAALEREIEAKPIDISVLLCTLNRAGYLEEVLPCLVGQDCLEDRSFEIVVVDNGSTDRTKAVVEEIAAESETPIRYVYESIKGVHQARNRSLREGRGQWFAFMDDDELPDEAWLATLHTAAQQTGAKVLGGSVSLLLSETELNALGNETRASLRERSADRFGEKTAPFKKGTFPGTDNLMINREIVEKVGDFDETMIMGGADYDLMIRAKNAGFDPWYVPKAMVSHRVPPVRLTAEFLKNDAFQSGVMLALLRRRYSGWFTLVLEMVARIGQAALVTVPMMAKAAMVNDDAGLLDRKIKWWRAGAFIRYTLMVTFPWLPGNQSYLQRLDFRRGRTTASHKSGKRRGPSAEGS